MGSGKSTVANLVARRTGKDCVDLDAEIERRSGRTIPEIFSESGESRFRELESEAIAELDSLEAAVIAVGGGTPELFANRRRMRKAGVTVWLDVNLDEARRRIPDGPGRPRWKNKNSLDFQAFFQRRRALYALADGRVASSGTTPEEVAAAVVALFEGFFD